MGFYSASLSTWLCFPKDEIVGSAPQTPHLPTEGNVALLVREGENAETAIWARKLIDFCCKARAGGKEKYHEFRQGPGAWQGQPAHSDEKCQALRCCLSLSHPVLLALLLLHPRELLPKTSVIQPKCCHQGQGGERKWSLVCCYILVFVSV